MEKRVKRQKKVEPVQGFKFETAYAQGELAERDGTICQIVDRDEAAEAMVEFGAAFKVRFGDGFETSVYASELLPWYPFD